MKFASAASGARYEAPIPTRSSLEVLVSSLRAIDSAGDAAAPVERILENALITDAHLQSYTQFAPGSYTRNCVYRGARFEVVVLCWSAGSASAIHNHGNSRCFVKVLRGLLAVDNYRIVAGGLIPGYANVVQIGRETMATGDIDIQNAAHDIHRVAAIDDAISLHVYAQPLDRCLVYDVVRESCSIAVNRYDRGPEASSGIASRDE